MTRFGLSLDDNRKSAEKSSKKIMQPLFALKYWYLHHHGLCTFFVNFIFHFLKMDIFIFSKMSKIENRE